MYKLILLLVLSVPASISALQLYDLNGQCGNHVRIFTAPLDSTPASTGTDNIGEFIAVDSDFLREQTDAAVWFVFFHECGHRFYKHTKQFRPPNREAKADCYAAKRFVDIYGYLKLEETLLDLRNEHDHARNMRILSCLR